jgi:hypothetical protein
MKSNIPTSRKTVTVRSIIARLDKAAKILSKKERGARTQLYDNIQLAHEILVRLEKNALQRVEFSRKIGKAAAGKRFNLAFAVVARVMGAKSRTKRKLASKACSALEYIRRKNIAVAETAEKLKKLGGIEKIAKLARIASDQLPAERNEKPKFKKNKPKSSTSLVGEGAPMNQQTNDKDIEVTVYMKLSDRDQIAAQPVGTRLKLTALRIGQKQADLTIEKVKSLSILAKTDPSGQDDW